MANDRPRIEPAEVVRAVEMYVDQELTNTEKFSNRQPLDESGIWSLHALAAAVYAMGWRDGERSADERARAQARRDREAARESTGAVDAG